MKLKAIYNRIYSDYLLPSRIDEMRNIYQVALEEGYQICSVEYFWELIKANVVSGEQKYFISRHDIDTGLATTKRIFELEKSLGIKTSYYFRLSHLDFDLMKEIKAYGSEVSYHFEEIATLAKKYRWKRCEDIDWTLCKKEFSKNYSFLVEMLGFYPKTVCAHGDFVNRAMQVANHELLDDDIRHTYKIELETYDEKFMKFITARQSDTIYPEFFKPESPLSAIKRDEKVVYLLTHPRHWHKEFFVNTKDNLLRAIEGIKYR